jgi:uncharacterized protein (DUF58 family)
MEKSDIPINEIISRVKHLEIRARKLVEDALQSEYHSVFKGRGIEFNEVRNYFPGDDIRDIDWNVTARMGEPFIKTYIEERELTVIFACDISGSSFFGSNISKRQIMAEVTALLGFASFFNNDKAGLVLFSTDIEKVVPPAKNHSHLLRIIRDTWHYIPENRGTDLNKSLTRLNNILKRKTIIFLISDFLDTGYEKPLSGLSKKHEVIPIVVQDTMEEGININLKSALPILVDIEDIELRETRTIDLSSHNKTDIGRFKRYYRLLFSKLSLDFAEINNKMNYYREIELLLRKRAKQRYS